MVSAVAAEVAAPRDAVAVVAWRGHPPTMNLPEPFQARGHLEHFQDYHAFVLSSLDGIGFLAVHRALHRGTPTGVIHTHDPDNRKRGWVSMQFSPNGVRA